MVPGGGGGFEPGGGGGGFEPKGGGGGFEPGGGGLELGGGGLELGGGGLDPCGALESLEAGGVLESDDGALLGGALFPAVVFGATTY